MRRIAKVDKNQAAVITAMRRIGAYVLLTHQLKNAFDCVVVYRGKTFLVEIKNPGTLPKVYDRARLEKSLTDGERECMANVEARGVRYHIIASVEEAMEMLGVADQIKNKIK